MSFKYYPDPGHTVGRQIAHGVLTDEARVIPVPSGNRGDLLNMAIQPQAGASVTIETTLSPMDVIEAGAATWLDSGHGDITEAMQDVGYGACTAIRLTVTGSASYQLQL